MRGPIPAEYRPKQTLPIIDSREQLAYRFPNLGPPLVRGLSVADYSFVGGEKICRIERKSREDYLGSIFTDRFDREMELIKAFPCHALVIEGNWEWLESGDWRIRATAAQVVGKTIGFIESGVRVIFADDRERAQRIVEKLLFMCARRRWRECRTLLGTLTEEDAA